VKNGSVYSAIFELYPSHDTTIPAWMGHQTQALFLNLVGRFDPVLAARLHDEPGYRPYTVSPMWGGKLSGDTITLRRGQPCHLRVTLLDGGALWNALQIYFWEAGPISLRLSNTDFQLTRILVTPTSDPRGWAGSTDWQTLAALSAQSTITMYFETATAFSLNERRFCLFPEPRLVWASLLRTWNRYAPESMRIEKQIVRGSIEKNIAVTVCALRHAYLHFPAYVQKGFVGHCTYRLSVERSLTAQLTSLAALSRYSGVGYKTTMGMGQVRVEFDPAPGK
jgi:CRISPR-associated endoribonuclease Cas6